MKKTALLLLILIFAVASASLVLAGGCEEKYDRYTTVNVYDAEDFFENNYEHNFNIMADIDFGGAEINSIVAGYVYGNGHTISNVRIEGNAFFTEGDVRDLTFENVTLVCKGTGDAGIVAKEGDFQNVFVKNSSIEITGSEKGRLYVGGICGTVRERMKGCGAENVSISAIAAETTSSSYGGYLQVGGLFGYAEFESAITESYAKDCDIYAEGNHPSCQVRAGGAAGCINGGSTVRALYARGCSVSAVNTWYYTRYEGATVTAGGTVGFLAAGDSVGEVSLSFSEDNELFVRSSQTYRAGGFVGYSDFLMNNCYASGNTVTAYLSNIDKKGGGVRVVAGLAGLIDRGASNCFAAGNEASAYLSGGSVDETASAAGLVAARSNTSTYVVRSAVKDNKSAAGNVYEISGFCRGGCFSTGEDGVDASVWSDAGAIRELLWLYDKHWDFSGEMPKLVFDF